VDPGTVRPAGPVWLVLADLADVVEVIEIWRQEVPQHLIALVRLHIREPTAHLLFAVAGGVLRRGPLAQERLERPVGRLDLLIFAIGDKRGKPGLAVVDSV